MWLKSRVVHGEGKGKTLGFPTLNFHLKTRLPFTFGIYATRVRYKRKEHGGVLYWGTRGGRAPVLEIYLLDFSGDLYDQLVEFELGEFIREDKKFDSDSALVEQIKDDIEKAKPILAALKKKDLEKKAAH